MRNLQTGFYLSLFVLVNVTLVGAFSLQSFFKKSTTTSESKEEKVNLGKEENLQTLKVFEPKKDISYTRGGIAALKTANEETLSFDADNNILIDDISSGVIDDHSDNAVYTVQKGDSIYSIASYFGVSVDTITSYNHMSSKTVRVGDVLEVPTTTGIMYKIKKGDTLSSISTKYAVEPDDVSLYNGLLSSDDLAVNDEIFLPGAKELEVKKDIKKTISKTLAGKTDKTKITVFSSTLNDISSNSKWAKGDTSHLNTTASIKKYSSLPKYDGYYLLPVSGAVRTQKMHGNNGVDLAGKMGSVVGASADGVVKVAKSGGYNFGYGNYVIVSHGNGSESLYAHLQSVTVAPGESVSRGQQIGTLGSSGNSTGPHVHFEIRGAYNPFAW